MSLFLRGSLLLSIIFVILGMILFLLAGIHCLVWGTVALIRLPGESQAAIINIVLGLVGIGIGFGLRLLGKSLYTTYGEYSNVG